MIMGKRRGVNKRHSPDASHPALTTISFTMFTFSAPECDTEYTSYLPVLLGPPLFLGHTASNLTFPHRE